MCTHMCHEKSVSAMLFILKHNFFVARVCVYTYIFTYMCHVRCVFPTLYVHCGPRQRASIRYRHTYIYVVDIWSNINFMSWLILFISQICLNIYTRIHIYICTYTSIYIHVPWYSVSTQREISLSDPLPLSFTARFQEDETRNIHRNANRNSRWSFHVSLLNFERLIWNKHGLWSTRISICVPTDEHFESHLLRNGLYQ